MGLLKEVEICLLNIKETGETTCSGEVLQLLESRLKELDVPYTKRKVKKNLFLLEQSE